MKSEATDRLDGAVGLVTGASGDIGGAIARELARRGARVVLGYHSSAGNARAVVETIISAGGTAMELQADLSTAESSELLVRTTVERMGELQILVNCAGVLKDQFMRFMQGEDWDEVLAVNLKAPFFCIKAAAPLMAQAGWGRVINIGSEAGRTGAVRKANYAAAKAGLHGLTMTAAREYASQGITVNTVSPGLIDTERTRGYPKSTWEAVVRSVPMGRAGQPEEVAALVGYLASPAASYVTGQRISVNGGMVT